MDDNPQDHAATAEREELVWKSRELLLRTRVLRSQLDTLKQTKEATLDVLKTTNESIKSVNDDKHHRLRLKQEQIVKERQSLLNQLNDNLGFAKSQIFRRSRRMIHELWDIYPIIEFPDRRGYSICDIHLPKLELFEGHDETMLSVAIGYVGHLLLLLSEILDINLRFPLRYYGSRSLIYCNRKNQLFPLYVDSLKSKEWMNFSYGMNLLNLDIVQIRTLYGLTTSDPDETLANLHGLKLLLDNDD